MGYQRERMPNNTFQVQFKRLQQRRELLAIFIFLFVIVIFWIGVELFSSQHQTGVTSKEQAAAAPLSPTLNIAIIEKLEQKKLYGTEELGGFPIYTVADQASGSAVLTGAGAANSVNLPSDLEQALQSLEEGL